MTAANRCRMHLRAVTKADITNGDGTKMLRAAWEVQRVWTSTSQAAYRWPRQDRPSKDDIQRWQKVIHATFGSTAKDLRWATPLGQWTQNALQQHEWWLDENENHLYQKQENGWRRWKKEQKRARTRGFIQTEDSTSAPPGTARPTVVTRHPGQSRVYMEGTETQFFQAQFNF